MYGSLTDLCEWAGLDFCIGGFLDHLLSLFSKWAYDNIHSVIIYVGGNTCHVSEYCSGENFHRIRIVHLLFTVNRNALFNTKFRSKIEFIWMAVVFLILPLPCVRCDVLPTKPWSWISLAVRITVNASCIFTPVIV